MRLLKFLRHRGQPGVVNDCLSGAPDTLILDGLATSVKTTITIPSSSCGLARGWRVTSTVSVPPFVPTFTSLSSTALFWRTALWKASLSASPNPSRAIAKRFKLAFPALLEVFARFAADIQNIAFFCDQHGCRGKPLEQHLVRERLQVGGGRERYCVSGRGCTFIRPAAGEGGRKFDEIGLLGGFEPPIYPQRARDRGKKIGGRSDILRAAQKQMPPELRL